MDNEELTDKLKENEKIIEDLNNQLNEHKFIQSQNKEYIFTLEAELNKKNKKIKKLNEKNKKYKFKPVNNENKSKKSKILDKFLNMSNRYVFYKNNYELLRNAHEYDNKIMKSRDSQIKTYRKENNFLKRDIKNKQKDINYLKKLLDNKSSEIQEKIINLQKKLGRYTKPEIIKKLNYNQYSDLTVAIKTPNPKGQHHWGDYFFSIALKKSFKKLGFNVIIQEREEWYDDVHVDINMVLRGLEKYEPNLNEINIMWNISHPHEVSNDEYELYDICFISSEKYANKINNEVNTIIKPLLQCTDPEVFYNEINENYLDNILFVGSTRGVYREIVKNIIENDFDVSVYGRGWITFIDEKYIKGQFIPNEKLHEYYSSCKILLNDHWDDMRDWDFPSNRLFDALACGTFVISDKIPSAETLFEGNIVTYEDAEDLKDKIDYYLTHDEEREEKARKGRDIVLNNHTFDNRVDTIIESLKCLKSSVK